jgi:hypothetical protein
MSDPLYFKAIVKTFLSVYPHVSLWYLPQTSTSVSHPHLVGSVEDLAIDYQLVASRLARPAIQRDLRRLHATAFSTPEEFIAERAMGEDALRELVADVASLNTDDLPVAEFYAPVADMRAETRRTKAILLGQIVKYLQNPLDHVTDVPEEKRAFVKAQVERLVEGYRDLTIGHAFLAMQEYTGKDYSAPIHQFYRRAFSIFPDNAYLKDYFQRP